jgi:endonuclease YncB( thermonuclease family)
VGKIITIISYCIFFAWGYSISSKEDFDVKKTLFGARRTTPVKESFEATYVSNYDADTVTVNIKDVPKVFGQHIAVRIKHVDSPEINSLDPCARKVAYAGKEAVGTLLSTAKSIKLVEVERDKYFRLLAEVIVNDSVILHDFILENNYAVSYEGDAKLAKNWCK